jgi:hypothetical protein
MLEDIETAVKNRDKIKVLVVMQPNANKIFGSNEKAHNADIVILKHKSGYEIVKNKIDGKFSTLENIEKFKKDSKYIVEEFEQHDK